MDFSTFYIINHVGWEEHKDDRVSNDKLFHLPFNV